MVRALLKSWMFSSLSFFCADGVRSILGRPSRRGAACAKMCENPAAHARVRGIIIDDDTLEANAHEEVALKSSLVF